MENPLAAYWKIRGRGALADLARKARIPKSTLSAIAKGQRDPTLEQARRMDAATGGAVAFEGWKDQAA